MTQEELSEILHDIGCPVNEGVSSLKNEKVFPRIDYWEILWEDTMASGDDYENEITWQISFYARKPRDPKLIRNWIACTGIECKTIFHINPDIISTSNTCAYRFHCIIR